ncbi:MAG: glucosamine-6-phosphate deaminase [Coriobacteriia bacterium]|nr:glucosamine-6-phosphate deaminase [Coriobacteriia bacterium]MCL2749842.1 glucosamine-6-phosphate deaminase [Coriobacteriia bacterium]
MNIQVYGSASKAGVAVAQVFAAQIIRDPFSVLGLATGSTPLPTYEAMVELYKAGIVDFSTVRTFNLDEYVGISREHEQSYYSFMFEHLFSQINIDPAHVQVPNPVSENLDEDCIAYDAAIDDAGGIDLQLLGIGHNGHIAFNEPGDLFTYGTHIVELSKSTIEANKRFFASADEVPKKAMTMGIGTIMKAREIVLVASGKDKAQAVATMILGEIDPLCPASALLLHPQVTVFLDADAASLLH